jgi:hypothetical protein
MDASQLWYPELVQSSSNKSFTSFYTPKVSEMLWNTPKHHFWSNRLEWMLDNFRTSKLCIQAWAQVLQLLHAEGQRNALKHSQTSFWVPWSRMDTSQLRYPIVHLGSKHRFCFFLRTEGLPNASKHTQTSFWVQWTRMDSSQHWFPEIVHSGPAHKFCIFLRTEG